MNKKALSTAVTVIAAVLAAGLAAWGGYVFCMQVKINGDTPELYALIPVYIILLFLGAFLDDLIHEGAHFLVGACCSMGVKVPKIRMFKSSSVEVYPKGAKAMRLRFTLTAAAGLFFDLLIIVLGIIAFAVPSVHPLFGIGLPYALYEFIINVVPMEYASGKTDGLSICEVLSKNDSAQVMIAVLKVQGLVNGGMFLREIDESLLLDVPQIQEDDINFIMLTQLRFEYYEAIGNDTEAYKYFLRYQDLIQYLPSEYGGTGAAGRKVEIETVDDEEEEQVLNIDEMNGLKSGLNANEKNTERTEQPKQQPAAPEKPAEPARQSAQPEQTENKK